MLCIAFPSNQSSRIKKRTLLPSVPTGIHIRRLKSPNLPTAVFNLSRPIPSIPSSTRFSSIFQFPLRFPFFFSNSSGIQGSDVLFITLYLCLNFDFKFSASLAASDLPSSIGFFLSSSLVLGFLFRFNSVPGVLFRRAPRIYSKVCQATVEVYDHVRVQLVTLFLKKRN
ncbi:hypothetical protein Csa_017459 [Cucumis sativus]|uniref:Uncharacterized protein n=1 Tax=Cucumis sativus TaxID=3659 RepID=A0A0A0L8P3_CUCSA|nr:hypothetical protein Csa_017459 [Cucumis sativus]